MTISAPTPLAAWGYAFAALGGACWWTFYSARSHAARRHAPTARAESPEARVGVREGARDLALLAIAACGAIQLLTGATAYRYATLDGWTRAVALVATVFLAQGALSSKSLCRGFLRAFVWFAALVSVTAVLAYFTSPGQILWLFPSPYPDTWGPFLSRNDFAAFLELAFPVALWMGLGGAAGSSRQRSRGKSPGTPPSPPPPETALRVRPRRRHSGRSPAGRTPGPTADALYLCLAAWLLAAGFASASRAGSALLAAEALVILARRATRGAALKFAAAAVLLIAIAGAGTLLHRWGESDPLRYRREMQRSALEMIAERPMRGFGIGAFARVYPAYAHFDVGAVVEHAHNDWLEWAAEGGLPYALAWLAVAVSVAKPAARSIWGLGVMAVFLHAFVDYPFARFGVSAWTMALIGAFSAEEMREVSVRAH